MSAYLDALAGATYDGSDYGTVSQPSDSASVQGGIGADYFIGALQTLTSLGTGYLSKRIDIDLNSRVYGGQPIPRVGTTQNPIGGYGTVVCTPQGQQVAQLNLSLLGPLLMVAAVAWFVARRGS